MRLTEQVQESHEGVDMAGIAATAALSSTMHAKDSRHGHAPGDSQKVPAEVFLEEYGEEFVAYMGTRPKTATHRRKFNKLRRNVR